MLREFFVESSLQSCVIRHIDSTHFQPISNQFFSISTYNVDECFGAIRELQKVVSKKFKLPPMFIMA
ncbi:hypothetical protein V1477_000460, partial [Vespula maculifrons]